MKTKKFDCVEMKRKSSEHIYKKVANMTKAEQLQYWREGHNELLKVVDELKKKKKKAA